VSDPVVERMVRLHKDLENAAESGGVVHGWHPLRIDNRGWVVAGKTVDGEYQIKQFYPIGEWKNALHYLEIEAELRSLIFSDVSVEQIDAYRTAVGLRKSEGR
jgi:hypothetical protein